MRSATALPAGSRTRIHGGLRSTGAPASNFAVFLAILSAPSSCAPTTFTGMRSRSLIDATISQLFQELLCQHLLRLGDTNLHQAGKLRDRQALIATGIDA